MIGGGPKCLFALLELNDCLDAGDGPVHVDVYDPYPPGAGRVWNTGQPRELRLNVNPRIIDASSTLCTQTFNQWRATKDAHAENDTFPARALVGEYLNEQFQRLVEQGALQVTHRANAVTSLVRRGPQWEVSTQLESKLYDEVVISTGHGLAGYQLASTEHGTLSAAELTVERTEGLIPAVPAGSQVLVRGAALTAYDVVLTLTEGRGGRWEQITEDGLSALRYLPRGEEPSRIILTSRSNISLSPKPLNVPQEVRDVLDTYREPIRRWGSARKDAGRVNGQTVTSEFDGLWSILLACAVQCTGLVGVPANEATLWSTVLAGISEEMKAKESPAAQLRTSLRANHGLDTYSHEWVWGVVWAGLYPQIVDALSRISWAASERKQFRIIAANLERMAFGPPELTALKLLALYDAGILSHEPLGQTHQLADVVTINAVTAPAGVLIEPDGKPANEMIRDLLTAGEVLVRSGERGLLTDTDGTCLNVRGERNESLTALGRPTEDPTLGHDTLNRNLHPEFQEWAKRIKRLVAAPSQKVAAN